MSKIEFCAACGASIPHGAAVCEECGQRRTAAGRAPRRAREVGAASRPRSGARERAGGRERSGRGDGERRRPRRSGFGNWALALFGVAVLAAVGIVLWPKVGDRIVATIGGHDANAAATDAGSATVPSPAKSVAPLVRKREPQPFAPLVHLRIDSFEPLLALSPIRALQSVLRERDGAGSAAVMPLLERAIEAMPRPFEIDVVATERDDLVVVMRLPSRERLVQKHWSGLLVGPGSELRFDGGSIGRYFSPFGAAFEAVIGDTDHFVTIVGARQSGDTVAWLSRHFGAAPALDAAEQRQWDQMPPGGVRMLLSLRRLAAMTKVSTDALLRDWFGDGSLAVTSQFRVEAQRLVIDTRIDAGTPGSVLGELLKGTSAPRLLTWLPASAREFAAFAFDVDTVDRVLAMPALKGALSDDPLVRELYEFATGSWDGQVALLSEPPTAAEALEPESDLPFVALLGADDASATIARVAERLESRIVEDFAPEASVHGILGRAGREVFLVAARGDVVWFAGADVRSRRLLRESIRTGGKQSVPDAWAKQTGGGMPPAPDSVWLGSYLDDLAGRIARNHEQGQSVSDIQREMAEALARSPGTYAGWMALGPDGWRMRVLN